MYCIEVSRKESLKGCLRKSNPVVFFELEPSVPAKVCWLDFSLIAYECPPILGGSVPPNRGIEKTPPPKRGSGSRGGIGGGCEKIVVRVPAKMSYSDRFDVTFSPFVRYIYVEFDIHTIRKVSTMAAGTTIQFSYAGKVRICKVVTDSADYVKAENISCDGCKAERPFSNYTKSQIVGLTIIG